LASRDTSPRSSRRESSAEKPHPRMFEVARRTRFPEDRWMIGDNLVAVVFRDAARRQAILGVFPPILPTSARRKTSGKRFVSSRRIPRGRDRTGP
jgi:hypothetical protein